MAFFNLTSPTTVPQTLLNGEAGIVGTGASIQSFGTAVTMNGVSYLMNNGLIVGFGKAVDAQNTDRIEIQVGASGTIQSNGQGIDADVLTSTRIVNHGSIPGTVNALRLTADAGAVVSVDHEVINTGFLVSTSNGPSATVFFESTNVGFIEFSNSGVVSSTATAIDNSSTTTGFTIVRNTGEILAGQELVPSIGYAYLGSASFDYIINQGFISGEIDLGAANDFYNAAGGHTSGRVLGGTGNDTLQGGANADVLEGGDDADLLIGRAGDDVMEGGAGNDMMLGGGDNDSMTGGNNNDTMNGNAGDDTLEGGAGNDVLVGQDGSDFLDGGTLEDLLDGGNGDDVLEGGDGNDILRGRAGEDELAGGLGRDYLTGGQDADQFVFRALAETVVGALRDQILDFEQGLDNIVVAGLSPGVFEFRGTAPFAPSGNPELRLFETATGSTIVQLDANGDGTADAEIRVANVTGLTADDFTL